MEREEELRESRESLALAERCIRLDRLYLAAERARDAFLHEMSAVNYRRWQFYRLRYERLVAEYPR